MITCAWYLFAFHQHLFYLTFDDEFDGHDLFLLFQDCSDSAFLTFSNIHISSGIVAVANSVALKKYCIVSVWAFAFLWFKNSHNSTQKKRAKFVSFFSDSFLFKVLVFYFITNSHLHSSRMKFSVSFCKVNRFSFLFVILFSSYLLNSADILSIHILYCMWIKSSRFSNETEITAKNMNLGGFFGDEMWIE